MQPIDRNYTAFVDDRLIFSGLVRDTVGEAKRHLDQGAAGTLLIFDDLTGQQVEFDFQGSLAEVLSRLDDDPAYARAASDPPLRPGRPKLGVISREVSLLPRHWEWLERQPGGLSGTLRRLVETESKVGRAQELARNAREATSKFMWAMAGNLPGFEEASRALYAKDDERLRGLIRQWPKDIRAHVERLLAEAARLDVACA